MSSREEEALVECSLKYGERYHKEMRILQLMKELGDLTMSTVTLHPHNEYTDQLGPNGVALPATTYKFNKGVKCRVGGRGGKKYSQDEEDWLNACKRAKASLRYM